MKFIATLLLIAPLVDAQTLRTLRKSKAVEVEAPHEVHQFEQVKFYDEPEWDCRFDNIQDVVGCLVCKNGKSEGNNALIVEVKAMYKRSDWTIKDETVNPPRKHCLYPEHGEFWTCFNSNLVIEPDTTWLPPDIRDKPIYNSDGGLCTAEEDCVCYPADLIPTSK